MTIYQYVSPREQADNAYRNAASMSRRPAMGAREWQGVTQADHDERRRQVLQGALRRVLAARGTERSMLREPDDDTLEAMAQALRARLEQIGA